MQARASAEAAKALAAYAKMEAKLKVEMAAREAELQLEKLKLEAELSSLAFQRAAATAVAQPKHWRQQKNYNH